MNVFTRCLEYMGTHVMDYNKHMCDSVHLVCSVVVLF